MAKKLNMFTGIDKETGKLVGVDNVTRGKECNCICTECGAPLIAKQGSKNTHHFCHDSNYTHGESCGETNMHKTAKFILQNNFSIVLPPTPYILPNNERECVFRYNKVYVEQKEGDIIPDIVLENELGSKLYIEIYVTHKIDPIKFTKILRDKRNTIEIDLSNTEDIMYADLYNIITKEIKNKKWIYNNKAYEMNRRILSDAYIYDGIDNVNCFFGEKLIKIYKHNFKEVAEVDKHCSKCKFNLNTKNLKDLRNLYVKVNNYFKNELIFNTDKDLVKYYKNIFDENRLPIPLSDKYCICLCKEFYLHLGDYYHSNAKQRVDNALQNNKQHKYIYNYFKPRICPNCGGKLVVRVNKSEDNESYGKSFIGCSNYHNLNCMFSLEDSDIHKYISVYDDNVFTDL